MKIHRFIGGFDFKPQTIIIEDKETVHQIRNVLKLRIAEQIALCDGRGHDIVAAILEIKKDQITVGVQERFDNACESGNRVTLYCSILKRENFELVVQKATEVGVFEIVPLICQRTIKTDVKAERLNKIAKEAAELSGRGVVPVVREPLKFEIALEQAKDHEANFFFDAANQPLDKPLSKNQRNVAAWIGPEGGWTEDEIAQAKKSKLVPASLGTQTLRGETAAIIAAYELCRV